MVDGPSERARHTFQVGIAQETPLLAAWQGQFEEVRIEVVPECGRLANINGHLHALDNGLDVVRMAQVSGINDWMIIGIPRAQFEVATALGAQQHGVNGETWHFHVVFVVGPYLDVYRAVEQ